MDELVRTIAEALAERWTRPTEENPEWRRQYRKNPDTTEPEFLDVPMDERIERSCSTVERAGDGYPSIRPLAFVEVAEVAAEAVAGFKVDGSSLASGLGSQVTEQPDGTCSPDGLVELMKVLAECDTDGEGIWPRVQPDGSLVIHINCNDLFYWACADAEKLTDADLPLLRQCKEDLTAAEEFGEVYLLELFCCRKRQMRPQFPFFRTRNPETCVYDTDTLVPSVRALFDACGPEGSDLDRG